MEAFFDWSGWLFGCVSLVFGLIQLFEKKKYQKKYNTVLNDYRQIKEEYKGIRADNGSIAVGKNTGGMYFNG